MPAKVISDNTVHGEHYPVPYVHFPLLLFWENHRRTSIIMPGHWGVFRCTYGHSVDIYVQYIYCAVWRHQFAVVGPWEMITTACGGGGGIQRERERERERVREVGALTECTLLDHDQHGFNKASSHWKSIVKAISALSIFVLVRLMYIHEGFGASKLMLNTID